MEADDPGGSYPLENQPEMATSVDPFQIAESLRHQRIHPTNCGDFLIGLNQDESDLTNLFWLSEYSTSFSKEQVSAIFSSIASAIYKYGQESMADGHTAFDTLLDAFSTFDTFRTSIKIRSTLLDDSRDEINLMTALDLLYPDGRDEFLKSLPEDSFLRTLHLPSSGQPADVLKHKLLTQNCIRELLQYRQEKDISYCFYDNTIHSNEDGFHFISVHHRELTSSFQNLYRDFSPQRFLLIEASNSLSLVQLDLNLSSTFQQALTNAYQKVIQKIVEAFVSLPKLDQSVQSNLRPGAVPPLSSTITEQICQNPIESCNWIFISGLPAHLLAPSQREDAKTFIRAVAAKANLTIKVPTVFETIRVGNYQERWSTLVELERPYSFGFSPAIADKERIRQQFLYVDIPSTIPRESRHLIGITAFNDRDMHLYHNSRTLFYVRRLATRDSSSLAAQRTLIADHISKIIPNHRTLVIPLVVKQNRTNAFKDGKLHRTSHVETIFGVQMDYLSDEMPAILAAFGLSPDPDNHGYPQVVHSIHSVNFVFTVSPKFIPNLEPPKAVFYPTYTSSFTIPGLSMTNLSEYIQGILGDDASATIDFIYPIIQSNTGVHIRKVGPHGDNDAESQIVVVWKDHAHNFKSSTFRQLGISNPQTFDYFPGHLRAEYATNISTSLSTQGGLSPTTVGRNASFDNKGYQHFPPLRTQAPRSSSPSISQSLSKPTDLNRQTTDLNPQSDRSSSISSRLKVQSTITSWAQGRPKIPGLHHPQNSQDKTTLSSSSKEPTLLIRQSPNISETWMAGRHNTHDRPAEVVILDDQQVSQAHVGMKATDAQVYPSNSSPNISLLATLENSRITTEKSLQVIQQSLHTMQDSFQQMMEIQRISNERLLSQQTQLMQTMMSVFQMFAQLIPHIRGSDSHESQPPSQSVTPYQDTVSQSNSVHQEIIIPMENMDINQTLPREDTFSTSVLIPFHSSSSPTSSSPTKRARNSDMSDQISERIMAYTTINETVLDEIPTELNVEEAH